MGKAWKDRGEALPSIGIDADPEVIRYCDRYWRRDVDEVPNTRDGREELVARLSEQHPDGARVAVRSDCVVEEEVLARIARGEHRVHRVSQDELDELRAILPHFPEQEGGAALLAEFAADRGRRLATLHSARKILGDELELEDVREHTMEEWRVALGKLTERDVGRVKEETYALVLVILHFYFTLAMAAGAGFTAHHFTGGSLAAGVLAAALMAAACGGLFLRFAGDIVTAAVRGAKDMIFGSPWTQSTEGANEAVMLLLYRERIIRRKVWRSR